MSGATLRDARHAARRSLVLELPIEIRLCVRADLPQLEWYGLYWRHRAIFRDAFRRQRRGENLMLLAMLGEFPVAQLFIDLARRRTERTAVYWAVRVYPFLQGHGLGSTLVRAAEDHVRAAGLACASLGVEKTNPGARRFYERLGYRVVGDLCESHHYTRPDGSHGRMRLDEWRLLKVLDPAQRRASEPSEESA